MRTLRNSLGKKGWIAWLSGGALIACLCVMVSNTAKSDDLPGLSIRLLTNAQLQMVVTNGAATNTYTIYRRFALDEVYPWVPHLTGTNGQTNFTASMNNEWHGFFQARLGADSDGDGAPDWADGAPNDPSLGLLTIIIDTPLNGTSYQ